MIRIKAASAFLWVGILAAFSWHAFAKEGFVAFEEKVRQSDLIAVVQISSVEQQKASSGYRQQAYVKVVAGIKGVRDGDTVMLEYDNGLACPNVLYSDHEKCLIFATRMPNGHYETFNTYYGKAVVEGETSKGVAGDLTGKLDDVIARIKAVLDGKKP